MKFVSLILGVFISTSAYANDSARSLVLQELTTYSSDYGISDIEVGNYLGVINKKYSFNVAYSKIFCDSVACAKYQCQTVVGLDSDAITDFEAEKSAEMCLKL